MKKKVIMIGLVIIISITLICFLISKKIVKKKTIIKTKVTKVETKVKPIDLKYYQNYYNNKDIVAYFEIKDTDISSLIVQGTDNDYYLNHNLKKEETALGSVILDYRVHLKTTKQINLYGHNSPDLDTTFKKLESFLNYDFYEKYQYITIKTDTFKRDYQIFIVKKITKTDDEHMIIAFANNTKYLEHLNKLKENSLYLRDININNKQLLILQTCLYNPSSNLLIIAQEV